MAREPEVRIPGPPERDEGTASGEQIALVLLAATAVLLVVVGVSRPGSGPALAVGSMAGALALVLVARRSMEVFVLLVLVLRPTLDGLHASSGVAATDPARVLGVLFVAVSLVWWGSRWLEGRRHPSSAAGLALAAFLVAAAVATLGSQAPGHSAAELARLGTAVLMFFVVDRLCEDTGRPDRVLGAVLAAAAIPVAVAVAGPLVGIQPHRGQGPHRAGHLHLLAVEPLRPLPHHHRPGPGGGRARPLGTDPDRCAPRAGARRPGPRADLHPPGLGGGRRGRARHALGGRQAPPGARADRPPRGLRRPVTERRPPDRPAHVAPTRTSSAPSPGSAGAGASGRTSPPWPAPTRSPASGPASSSSASSTTSRRTTTTSRRSSSSGSSACWRSWPSWPPSSGWPSGPTAGAKVRRPGRSPSPSRASRPR